MKTLHVLRHGQAEPETDGVPDHERPLTRRGRADALRAAASLLERSKAPSLVLSSSATRARDTAERCVESWPSPAQLTIVEGLYLAGPSSYVAALNSLGDPHASVMVVGHNPGLETLLQLLTARSEHLATASLVEVELTIEAWSQLSVDGRGQGRLVHAFRA